MEFWLWMPQLFACTRTRIKTQINRGLSPIIYGTFCQRLLSKATHLAYPPRLFAQEDGMEFWLWMPQLFASGNGGIQNA